MNSPEVQGAIQRLQATLSNDPRFPLPPIPTVSPSGDLGLLTLITHGEPSSQATVDAVTVLRDEYIPAAFAGVAAEVLVGGVSAASADVFEIVATYTPIVFVFVLGFSFIILMLVFRSIVIPIKAVIMNLLSVGATYGLRVLVFQKGVATDLLGFRHAEVVDVWIPLFLFSILFGLSMDYHVFLLSRIRERYDQTGNNAEAVAYGLRSTATIITGAALIMVCRIRRLRVRGDHHQPASRIRSCRSGAVGRNLGAFGLGSREYGSSWQAKLVPAIVPSLASRSANRSRGRMRVCKSGLSGLELIRRHEFA